MRDAAHTYNSMNVTNHPCYTPSRYALFVLDNQNLQDIWDFKTHPNLTILRGTVFFHQNHKLCLHKINELVRHVGLEGKVDDVDISKLNNGDQVACKLPHFPSHFYMVLSHHTSCTIYKSEHL